MPKHFRLNYRFGKKVGNTGVSEYSQGERRQLERVQAHNTVSCFNKTHLKKGRVQSG